MGKTLAMWMTAILSINMLFAPLLGYFDSLLREGVEVTLMEGAKKASIQGSWTTGTYGNLVTQMSNTLQTKYNINMSATTINYVTVTSGGGSVPLKRGEVLEASITIKRSPIFIFDIFNTDGLSHTKTVKIMSEFSD